MAEAGANNQNETISTLSSSVDKQIKSTKQTNTTQISDTTKTTTISSSKIEQDAVSVSVDVGKINEKIKYKTKFKVKRQISARTLLLLLWFALNLLIFVVCYFNYVIQLKHRYLYKLLSVSFVYVLADL